MQLVYRKAVRLWGKAEAVVLLIGIPAALLIWAYSNFATVMQLSEAKAEINDSKADLQKYVDRRHAEIRDELKSVKSSLDAQNATLLKVLLELRKK